MFRSGITVTKIPCPEISISFYNSYRPMYDCVFLLYSKYTIYEIDKSIFSGNSAALCYLWEKSDYYYVISFSI